MSIIWGRHRQRTSSGLVGSVCRDLAASVAIAFAAGPALSQSGSGVSVVSSEPERPGRPISARELAEVADIAAFAVSPDGHLIVYQVRNPIVRSNSIRLSWIVAPTDGSNARLATFDGGDPDLRVISNGLRLGELASPAVAWGSDSRSFYFTRRGNDGVQVWQAFVDGREATQLTHNRADVLVFEPSDDRNRLYFLVGRDRASARASDLESAGRGILVNDESIFEPRGNAISSVPGTFAWPECGTARFPLAGDNAQPACENALWVFDIRSLSERPASTAERTQWAHLVATGLSSRHGLTVGVDPPTDRLSSTGARATLVSVLPPEEAGPQPVQRLMATLHGRERHCGHQACTGQSLNLIGWDSSGTKILFSTIGERTDTITSGPRNYLYAWSPETDALQTIYGADGRIHHGIDSTSCQPSGTHVYCLLEAVNYPGRIVAFSLDRDPERIIADPNPWFEQAWTGRIDTVFWRDSFGDRVFGRLIYPRNYDPNTSYPAVVTGYYASGFLWDRHSEFPAGLFAQDGMIVLVYDMPFSWDIFARRRSHIDMTRESWRWSVIEHRPLDAIVSALSWMANHGLIDRSRIGITGLSSGAQVVENALIFSDMFAAASAATLTSHPATYFVSPASGRRIFEGMFGIPPGAPGASAGSTWNENSVGANAARVRAALLLNVADSEYYLTYPNFSALRDANRPVEMYVYPNEYHLKWQPEHVFNVFRRNDQWFRFWLQDEEDDDPVDGGQYVRWRELRIRRDRLESAGSN
jgi:dipeptidyl aminopeptidase/acylaminoacyl peptidase